MAQFPFKHADIEMLAAIVGKGLGDNAATYPAPPVDLADFQASIEAYRQADGKFIQANAMKLAATAERQQALADMKDKLKKQLRYAENTVSFDDAKLSLIGWADKQQRISAPPGQVIELKATEQTEGGVVLSWKAPEEGGKPLAYKILRRQDAESGAWINAETSIMTTIKLTGQPRHTDLQYKVIAMNKTGEGQESNTVNVVL